MQLHYNVNYLDPKGVERTETKIYASDPGSAMAKVLKQYPKAKIIKAWIEGFYRDGSGYQEWPAPRVQREPADDPKPVRALKPNERGCEFPFYDKVRTLKS